MKIIFALVLIVALTACATEEGIKTEQNLSSSVEVSSSEQSTAETPPKIAPNYPDFEDFILTLITNDNPIPYYVPSELATVQGDYEMDVRVAPYAQKMIEDAKNSGIDLLVVSAYRDYSQQQDIYDRTIAQYTSSGYSEEAAIAATELYIARAGASEHQLGLAIDIVTPSYTTLDSGFANTAAAIWLRDNAHNYGFILRYPYGKTDITGIQFEPWHFRYVGEVSAKEIYEQGLTLEEYLEQKN